MKTKAKKIDNPEDLCFIPATELRELIRNKLVSPVEVITALLNRIEKINPIINASCTIAGCIGL